eukprot:TRINITY_DN12615_c0_g1_i2.p1 TRINITY_DN12615_c0_g1~~TRINITY_DN12615_c0_g1_i2.p1  ORF type:complete len:123 (-),score=14.88 TRINITY_DN12615_c0_g1_i2:297-665(-)
MSSFLETGRVSHLTRLLAWYPPFYGKHKKSLKYIMSGNGPLPFSLRYYVAIMAASRWENLYLVQQLEHDFLLHNGDPMWLQGVKFAPQKVQNLLEINALLAHQPWLVTREQIYIRNNHHNQP